MGKSLIFSIAGSHKTKPRKKTKKSKKKKKSRHEKFIAGAIKHKGSFTRYCKAHGHKGASEACIRRALASGSTRRKKQAILARTLKRTAAHRAQK